MWASYHGYYDVAELFVQSGRYIHSRDDSALIWASTYGYCNIVSLLIQSYLKIDI
jgi:hypothetical protein